MAAEALAGGFGPVYTVLKAMEESGRIRRGYFVAGLGATQFAMPAALDLLRSLRDTPEDAQVVTLAATDPANPYGATLKWPGLDASTGRGATRTVGATVVLVDGALAGYLARGDRMLLAWVPASRSAAAWRGRGALLQARARARLHRATCSSKNSTACPRRCIRWRRSSSRPASRQRDGAGGDQSPNQLRS
jgi:ATP-dependent Lhr-like helicase